MSFRVWFLRMVWIVAAAVALSGCPGDENGNGTDPEGDGPTLAIGAVSDVTMGEGNETATITVTITSEDDADKTAEVTLAVSCGDAVELADDGKMKAVNGVAKYTDVDLGDHTAGANCTADASATLGGEEKKATQVKFNIAAAGNVATHKLAAEVSTNRTEAVEFSITVMLKKADDSAESGTVTFEGLSVKWTCSKDANDNFDYTSANPLTADSANPNMFKHSHPDDTADNADNSDCQAEVSVTSAMVDDAEVSLEADKHTEDITLLDA